MREKKEQPNGIERITKTFENMGNLIKKAVICLLITYLAVNVLVDQFLPQLGGMKKVIIVISCIGVIILVVKISSSKNENLQEEDKEASVKAEKESIEDLKKKEAEKAEKLKQMEAELKEKDRIICDLESKKEVFEKVLNREIPVEVGYYMVNKPAYDMFRTKLYIRKCILVVRLKQRKGAEREYNLEFQWKLLIKNNNSEPVRKAYFIYSGERGVYEHPKVTCERLGCRGVTIKDEDNEIEGIKTIGDDRFIEISFENELKEEETENICIEYILENYTYNCKRDKIWLVPDALGFAEISEFYIRFIQDGVIVKDETKTKFTKYRLSGRYRKEERSVKLGEYREEEASGEEKVEKYFEAEGSESMDDSLHDLGFVLTLTNKENEPAKF